MAAEERFSVSVSFRSGGDNADNSHVSFSTYRKTSIQQIVDSAMAFFKITPSIAQPQLVCTSGKQVLQWGPGSTVDDLKLTVPERQSLELVLQDDEPEVSFPIRDQYGNEDVLQARLYHPFLDAVRRLVEPAEAQAQGQQGQQQPVPEIDLYRASDVSPISLQNSPAACGLQGGEQLLVYKFGRTSREYWQQRGQPEPAKPITFSGLYISDYKNQFQGRPVFRHDLSMPLEPLLSTYCKWRGIDLGRASFLWLQFYMRLGLHDSGVARGMDDGDTIYLYDKQDLQGALWDAVLDGNVQGVRAALDAGALLSGPEGSFEAITCRWPLHAAAANNHIEVSKLLVARGADVDKLDAVSEPALWHAVEQGHGRMVEALLELGATASDLPAAQGLPKADYAALCHAAEKGSLPMVQLLLTKGANPYTYDDTGYCAYDYLVDQAKPLELLRALLDADSAFGTTQKQYQQAYQRLCAAVKRAQRYPALGCNCRTCNSVVEVRATEAEAAQTLKAQIGCVALVRAVQAGGAHCLDAMKLLHEKGALLDGQDQDGRTALHQAIRYNRLAEAKWLVSAGAHLDVPDFEGLLPLHQAACTGNVDFAKLLVEAGASINLHTVKYITQESLEAQTKKQETGPGGRKTAKKRNALDVTGLTTIGGNSALALAVRHGHATVVDYLLQQGALFDLKSPADSSAFHAALDRGAATVASKLLSHLNKPKAGKGGAPAALPALPSTSASSSTALVAAKPKAKSDVKDVRASSAGFKKAATHTSPGSDSDSQEAAAQCSPMSSSRQLGDEEAGGSGANGSGLGEVPAIEPALAVDAGAGLKEMVARERERLRQQLGLGRSQSSESSSTTAVPLTKAPSLMEQLAASKAAAAAAAAKAQLEAEARAKAEAAASKARAEAEAKARAEAEAKAKADAEARAKAAAEAKASAEAAAKARAEAEVKAKAEAAAHAEAAAAAQQEVKPAAEAAASSVNSSASVSQASSPASGSPPHSRKAQQHAQPQASTAKRPAAAAAASAHARANGSSSTQGVLDAGSDVSKQRDKDGGSKPATKPQGVQILFRSTTAAKPAPGPSPAPTPALSRKQAAAQAHEAAMQAAAQAQAAAAASASSAPAAAASALGKRGKKTKQVLSLDELASMDDHRSQQAGRSSGGSHGSGKPWNSFVQTDTSSSSNLTGLSTGVDGELDASAFPALCASTAGVSSSQGGNNGAPPSADASAHKSGSTSATPARSATTSRRSSFGGSNAPAAAVAAASAAAAVVANPQSQPWAPYSPPPPPPPALPPVQHQAAATVGAGSVGLQVQAPMAGLYGGTHGAAAPGSQRAGPHTPGAQQRAVPGSSPRSPGQLGGEELPWDVDHFESMVMSVVTEDGAQLTPLQGSTGHHGRAGSLQLGGFSSGADASPGALPAMLPGVQGALDLLSPVGMGDGSGGAGGELPWGSSSAAPTPQPSMSLAPAGGEDHTHQDLLLGLSSQMDATTASPNHGSSGLMQAHHRNSQTHLGLFAGDVWVGAGGGGGGGAATSVEAAAAAGDAQAAAQQGELGAWGGHAAAAWSSWGSGAVGAGGGMMSADANNGSAQHSMGAGPELGQQPGSPSLAALAMLRSASGTLNASTSGLGSTVSDTLNSWHVAASGSSQSVATSAAPGTPATSLPTAPSTPAPAPAAPRELDPLPQLPASLFDGDDGDLDLGFSSSMADRVSNTPASSGAGTIGANSHTGGPKPAAARALMGNHVHGNRNESGSGADTPPSGRMGGPARGFGQPPPPPHGMHPGFYSPGMEWYPQPRGWQPPPPPPPGMAGPGFPPVQGPPIGMPPHPHAQGLYRPGLSHMAPAWDAGGFWQQGMRPGQHESGGAPQQAQHGHSRGHHGGHGRHGHHGSGSAGHAQRYRAH